MKALEYTTLTYKKVLKVFFGIAALVLEIGAESERGWRLVQHDCDKDDHAKARITLPERLEVQASAESSTISQ